MKKYFLSLLLLACIQTSHISFASCGKGTSAEQQYQLIMFQYPVVKGPREFKVYMYISKPCIGKLYGSNKDFIITCEKFETSFQVWQLQQ